MRPATSTVGRRVGGGFGLSVALLALAGQVATFAHLALVPHEVCAEHGELIHAGSRVDFKLVASEASAALTAVPPAAIGHDDEHCSVLAHRREQSAPPQRMVSLGDVGVPAPLHLSARTPRSTPVATLRLAPKQSPPA